MPRNYVDFVTLCRTAAAGLLAFSGLIWAQESLPTDTSEPVSIHSRIRLPSRAFRTPGPGLPIWRYHFVSPVNGSAYTGYMVGADPFRESAGTIAIPVILVPLIVQFTNTSAGFTTTFDPTTAPDLGCTAGQTAMSLVENSPIFQNYPWTLNNVDVGVTQYPDAFQRANFWNYVQNANDYHTLLTYTVGEPLTLYGSTV